MSIFAIVILQAIDLRHDAEGVHRSRVGLGPSNLDLIALYIHALKLKTKICLLSSSEFNEGVVTI